MDKRRENTIESKEEHLMELIRQNEEKEADINTISKNISQYTNDAAILKEVNKAFNSFINQVKEITNYNVYYLEKASLSIINDAINSSVKIQRNIVDNLNKNIIMVDSNKIVYISQSYEFTSKDFSFIEKTTASNAYVTVYYKGTDSGYSVSKHSELIKKEILKMIMIIKDQTINDLNKFVIKIEGLYKAEKMSAENYKREIERINREKVNDEIRKNIKSKQELLNSIDGAIRKAEEIKRGIDNYVQ